MNDDDAKRIILERRARFIAAALAGLGISAAAAQACGGKEESTSTSDTQGQGGGVQTSGTGGQGGVQTSTGGQAGQPQVCLGMVAAGNDAPFDSGPQVCLGAGGGPPMPADSGQDANDAASDAGETEDSAVPMPCLAPVP